MVCKLTEGSLFPLVTNPGLHRTCSMKAETVAREHTAWDEAFRANITELNKHN